MEVKETSGMASPVSFLSLPLELRLQIYDLTLVNRYAPHLAPDISRWDGDKIMIFDQDAQLYSLQQLPNAMNPALLRVCREIYNEAVPILYSENVFAIESLGQYGFLNRIQPSHMPYLQNLFIRLPWQATRSAPRRFSWLNALRMLAEKGINIKRMKVRFTANILSYRQIRSQVSLGQDVEVVHALAKFRALEEMELSGYYAKHWPDYLEKQFGPGVVRTKRGYDESKLHLVEEFIRFQDSTEDLIP